MRPYTTGTMRSFTQYPALSSLPLGLWMFGASMFSLVLYIWLTPLVPTLFSVLFFTLGVIVTMRKMRDHHRSEIVSKMGSFLIVLFSSVVDGNVNIKIGFFSFSPTTLGCSDMTDIWHTDVRIHTIRSVKVDKDGRCQKM